MKKGSSCSLRISDRPCTGSNPAAFYAWDSQPPASEQLYHFTKTRNVYILCRYWVSQTNTPHGQQRLTMRRIFIASFSNPTRNPAQRLRVGKELRQNEREVTFMLLRAICRPQRRGGAFPEIWLPPVLSLYLILRL